MGDEKEPSASSPFQLLTGLAVFWASRRGRDVAPLRNPAGDSRLFPNNRNWGCTLASESWEDLLDDLHTQSLGWYSKMKS